MQRAHICGQCGKDLSPIRAVPDPHYALPIVVCPGCCYAVVRRPWLGGASRRTRSRILGAWRAFLFRVFVVGLPMLLMGLMVAAWSQELATRRAWPWTVFQLPDNPGEIFMDFRAAGSVALLCCTMLCGLGLTMMQHWTLWARIGVLLLGMLSFTLIEPLLIVIQWSGRREISFARGVVANLPPRESLPRVGAMCLLLLPVGLLPLLFGPRLLAQSTHRKVGRMLRKARQRKMKTR